MILININAIFKVKYNDKKSSMFDQKMSRTINILACLELSIDTNNKNEL